MEFNIVPKKSKLSAIQDNKHYNVKKLLKYHESIFDNNKDYLKDIESRLQNDSPESEKYEISKRSSYLRHQIQQGNKTIGPQWQARIERMFGLSLGTLDYPALRKKPVYVLVSCRGKDAHLLYNDIVKNQEHWHIVDECAFVAGSYDLVMRLYGTEEQISLVLSDHIYNVAGVQIQGTNTLFSLNDFVWQRYPIGKREKRPTPPYWYDNK